MESTGEIQNESALTIPDGGPLSSIGRKRGHVNMGRTAGPDYMEEVFKMSAEEGYRHFFYGSTQETLDKLKEKIEKITANIIEEKDYSYLPESKPQFGFWGVPPNDLSILEIFS